MSRRLPLSECLSPGAAWLPAGLWGPLAYLPHPFQSLLWNAETVLCRGNRAHQLAETNGRGRDEMDGAHGWASQREVEKKEKRTQRKEAKREESQSLGGIRGQEWGSGMVSSPWVSINSCQGVGLCALCFSSYCLGIPVGTLPAPMLGSHHRPNHSDQRQRGTSAG